MTERQADRAEERDFRRFRDEGDPEAMARVFDAVAPRLLLVAGHLTRDAGEAEDLVQATFLAALQDAGRWDVERPLVPWLVGILSHRALDQKRRNRVRDARSLEEEPEAGGSSRALDPQELVSSQETREAIASAVDALAEPYREVLILRVAHGLEPTEIAHTLGRSPGTVRMQLQRGREKLERALPQGLSLPAFLLADTGRGLAAVREVVLAKAGAQAAAAAATTVSIGTWTLGGLMLKGTMAVVGVFGCGVILWALFGPRPEREPAARAARAGEERIERAAQPLAPGGSLETAEIEAPTARRVAATRARGVELAVRVSFADDGTLAPNVGVYVRPARAGALGVEARTDASGTARLDDLERGTYRIDLDRWDEAPVQVELTRGRTLELSIPDGVDVEGLVVDPEGNAIGGADVFRLNEGHHDFLQWTATADTAGFFRLRDVAPSTAFVARAEGFQPSTAGHKGGRPRMRDAAVGRKADVRLVLGARGQHVFGRVVDELGRAVPHARLAFAVEEDTREDGASSFEKYRERAKPADLEAFSIRADASGLFSTRQVPAGTVTWFAHAVDAEAGVGVGTLEIVPGREQELEVVLGPGAGVVGILTDGDGRPVADYLVEHEWRGSAELGQLEHEFGMLLANRSALTAADGSFQLLGLLPGETGLEIRHPSGETLVRERIELALGELHTWTPQVERFTDLTVRVVGPSGEPLAGWGVGLCSRPGRLRYSGPDHEEGFAPNVTDAEGRYTYRHVRPRPMVVTAHAPTPVRSGEVPPPVAGLDGVHPGGEEAVVQVPVLPTASVRGRILDSAGLVPEHSRRGNEASPAGVQLRLGEFEECGKQRLDENGGFELQQLAAGTYTLVLDADGFPHEYELAELELAAGQTLDLGIVTPPEPAFVEILLVAEAGEPVEDPEVVLIRDGEDEWNGRRGIRDEDDAEGPIRIETVVPGSYTLVASGRRTWTIAPHFERIELAPGEHLRKTITVGRGRAQSFELMLPPHPFVENRRPFAPPSARIELQLYDSEGNFILRRREYYELFDVPGNRLQFELPLRAGTYRAFLEDHRDPALRRPRPSAEIEFEVPASGEPDVLLVELD